MESEVQDGSPLRQPDEVSLGREDKHLVVIQVGVHVAHEAHLTFLAAGFQHLTHLVHPLVNIAFTLDPLVAPVCSNASLGGLVHALCAYLYLHPLVVWPIDGDVQ